VFETRVRTLEQRLREYHHAFVVQKSIDSEAYCEMMGQVRAEREFDSAELWRPHEESLRLDPSSAVDLGPRRREDDRWFSRRSTCRHARHDAECASGASEVAAEVSTVYSLSMPSFIRLNKVDGVHG
jgi:hypothetical protein